MVISPLNDYIELGNDAIEKGAASLNTASIHKKESMKKLSACEHSICSKHPLFPLNLHNW